MITADIEADGLLHEVTKIHCIHIRDSQGKQFALQENFRDFNAIIKKYNKIVFQNGVGYDLPLLKKFSILDYELNAYTDDIIAGHLMTLYDTLVVSKLLNRDRKLPSGCPSTREIILPDGTIKKKRIGPHSLEAHGFRLGITKIKIEDWRNLSPEQYLERCSVDTEITEALYYDQHQEMNQVKNKFHWKDAYKLENKVQSIIHASASFGVKFDRATAEKHVQTLDSLLKDRADKVEPALPMKLIPKTRLKKPPTRQFKNDGQPTKATEKYFGALEYVKDAWFAVDHNFFLPHHVPLITHEQTQMKNQDAIKTWLVQDKGWKPQIFNTKDVTKDSKKRPRSKEQIHEKILEYFEQLKVTPYQEFWLRELEINRFDSTMQCIAKIQKKRTRLPSTPSFTIDQNKTLCPNLEILGADIKIVKDILDWLTFRSRRNVIKSEKGTGWLNDTRLNMDGRLSPDADTLGTPTARFTHKGVVNVPRCTSLFGAELRELFIADNDYYFCGWDAAGIEARIEAHYTFPYDAGEYARELLDGDVHQKNAEIFGCSRPIAKNGKYALTYGAQVAKLAAVLGCSLERAKELFDAFWEKNYSLGRLREDTIKEWKTGGGNYIKGLDGRGIMVRSPHAALNFRFQSAAVICMKHAMAVMDESVSDYSYNNQAFRLLEYHDESQWQVHKDLVKFRMFTSEEEAEEFDEKGWGAIQHHQDRIYRAHCPVGQLGVQSIRKAGKMMQLNVPLDAEYMLGLSWAGTH